MSKQTPYTDAYRIALFSNILEMRKAVFCFADCLVKATCSCTLSRVVRMIVGEMFARFLAVVMIVG